MSTNEAHTAKVSTRKTGIASIIIVALLIVAFMVTYLGLLGPASSQAQPIPSPTGTVTPPPTATPPPSAEAETVEDFVIDLPKRDGGRLNSEGTPDPGNAEAFRDFIADQAKHDPLTLYLYYMGSPLGEKKPLENETVLAKDGLIQNGNTYSKKGVKAYEEWLFLWELTDITAKSEISFQGTNTGVNGTTAVQEDGVIGDDKSGYDVTYKDASGQVAAQHSALDRCTQPTFQKPPSKLPPGDTDNPPPPTDNPPPSNPPGNEPKHPSEDPYPQGNAPTGGGQNANPGPGKYVEPDKMEQPPSKPYVPPAPPAPKPPDPKPSDPKPVPTKDPAPAPAPEPSAPTPSEPEGGCTPIPGVEDC
jgi:hypothetical protein